VASAASVAARRDEYADADGACADITERGVASVAAQNFDQVDEFMPASMPVSMSAQCVCSCLDAISCELEPEDWRRIGSRAAWLHSRCRRRISTEAHAAALITLAADFEGLHCRQVFAACMRHTHLTAPVLHAWRAQCIMDVAGSL